MEQIGQNYGFILYRTMIPLNGSAVNISIPGLRDRGIVFVNQVREMFDRLFDFHLWYVVKLLPQYTVEIWKRCFICTAMPTVYTSPA